MTALQILNDYRDDSRFSYLEIIVYPEQDVLNAIILKDIVHQIALSGKHLKIIGNIYETIQD